MGFPVRGNWKRLRTYAGERKACVVHRSGSNVVEGRMPQVGKGLHHVDDVRRSVGRAPMGHRCQVWAVGLGEHPIDRAEPGGLVQVGGRLEGDDAAERQVGVAVEASPRLVGTTREAVEDRQVGRAFRVEDVERLRPRVPGVDDERQRPLVGELDLRREGSSLNVTWRVVVEEVEAALADGDDVGVVEERRRWCRRRAWPRAGVTRPWRRCRRASPPRRSPARSWRRRSRR